MDYEYTAIVESVCKDFVEEAFLPVSVLKEKADDAVKTAVRDCTEFNSRIYSEINNKNTKEAIQLCESHLDSMSNFDRIVTDVLTRDTDSAGVIIEIAIHYTLACFIIGLPGFIIQAKKYNDASNALNVLHEGLEKRSQMTKELKNELIRHGCTNVAKSMAKDVTRITVDNLNP